MTVSYEFLKQQLMKVKVDEDMGKLGFGSYIPLTDRMNDETYFERLWVSKNEEGIEVIVLDQGNSYADVIGFLDEFINDKKVFDQETYGYLTTYDNEEYQEEMEQSFEFALNILAPERENVHKIHAFQPRLKNGPLI